MGVLSAEQLSAIGFYSVGEDVRISDKASFYGASRIRVGNHVRIDDFCVLSAGPGGINIGDYIHIAVYSSLIGASAISLADFCNISSRVSIYSSSDDYSGRSMTNPMVPDEFKNVAALPVAIGRHVIIGSGSVVLPGVTVNAGAAVGALSLVSRNCDEFGVYAGVPAKKISERSRDLLELEKQFLSGSRADPR